MSRQSEKCSKCVSFYRCLIGITMILISLYLWISCDSIEWSQISQYIHIIDRFGSYPSSTTNALSELSILSDDDRIRYYMGKWFNKSNNVQLSNNNWTIFQKQYLRPYIAYYSLFNDTRNRERYTKKELNTTAYHIVYTKPFWNLLNLSSKSYDFQCKKKQIDTLVVIGDEFHHERYKQIPVFSKTRIIYRNDLYNNIAILIQEMEYSRHWGVACDLDHNLTHNVVDIEWNKKINGVIWRGATTDGISRRTFVQQYINYTMNETGIDVGFTRLVQIKPPETIDDLKPFKKEEMKRTELLKYKYLVSIEGNDVASNLKWLLSSNSVVFMSAPRRESWLMEGLLKPYIHYVPLSVNITNGTWNLEQQLKFCLNNDEICNEIAQNGKKFINENRFCDKKHEQKLQQKILDIYCMQNFISFAR